MLRILFTLDYEIHGSGRGSPWKLMVEPTERMLELFDHFGAKLTIMADVAEIWRFKDYFAQTGRDSFWSEAIEAQLRRALSLGHDVQLHIHSGYLGALHRDGVWEQDYADYDLARLGYDRLVAVITEGKEYLERLLGPVTPGYRCQAFRAANWSVHPSLDIARALVRAGIRIDTSVFKFGKSEDLVRFDYRQADSDLIPWPAASDDLCRRDEASQLFEFPIFCEERPLWAFLTPNRIYRVIEQARNPLPSPAQTLPGPPQSVAGSSGERASRARRLARSVTSLHPRKMDFNQCTGKQLIGGLKRAEARYGKEPGVLPFVLIGHSKTFTRLNEISLTPFLRFVQDHPDRFQFGTFGQFDLEQYRRPRGASPA